MLNQRKEIEIKDLKGVILAPDSTKLKPGYFSNLQNWVPSKKTSIKKKRGVQLLNDTPGSLLNIQQNWTCGVCTPEPAAQELEWIATSFGEGYGANKELNISHVETFPDGTDEIYAYVYDLSSAYDSPINAVLKLNMGNVVGANQRIVQVIPFVPAIDGGTNGLLSTQSKGKDRRQYIWYTGVFGTNNMQVFNVNTNQAVVMAAVPSIMASNHSATQWGTGKCSSTSISSNLFCATDGNFLYQTGRRHNLEVVVVKWDLASGTAIAWTDTIAATWTVSLIGSIQATNDWLYVLFFDDGASTTRLARLNKETLSISASWNLGKTPDNQPWTAFHVVGDNLVFLMEHDTNSHYGFYFFNISTNGPVKVIDFSIPNDPSPVAAGGVFPCHNMFVNTTPDGNMWLYFVEHSVSNGTALRKYKFRCF